MLLTWNPLLALFCVLASCLYLQYHSQLSLPYHFSFLKFSCSSDITIFKTPFAHGSWVLFFISCCLCMAINSQNSFRSFGTLTSPSVMTLLFPIRQHGAAVHRKLSEVHEGVEVSQTPGDQKSKGVPAPRVLPWHLAQQSKITDCGGAVRWESAFR